MKSKCYISKYKCVHFHSTLLLSLMERILRLQVGLLWSEAQFCLLYIIYIVYCYVMFKSYNMKLNFNLRILLTHELNKCTPNNRCTNSLFHQKFKVSETFGCVKLKMHIFSLWFVPACMNTLLKTPINFSTLLKV